jgi:hypothetical protein
MGGDTASCIPRRDVGRDDTGSLWLQPRGSISEISPKVKEDSVIAAAAAASRSLKWYGAHKQQMLAARKHSKLTAGRSEKYRNYSERHYEICSSLCYKKLLRVCLVMIILKIKE